MKKLVLATPYHHPLLVKQKENEYINEKVNQLKEENDKQRISKFKKVVQSTKKETQKVYKTVNMKS